MLYHVYHHDHYENHFVSPSHLLTILCCYRYQTENIRKQNCAGKSQNKIHPPGDSEVELFSKLLRSSYATSIEDDGGETKRCTVGLKKFVCDHTLPTGGGGLDANLLTVLGNF